jgi:hypothetical protein
MTANQTSPRAGAGAPRLPLIERRLRRYASPAQARVRALAQCHPRLADLAASFPALLFALALPRAGHDPARAIACVIDGRPLGEVAAAAGIPLWLRRLPVDGLTRPLPALPGDELFARRIANHVPRSPKRTAAWLAAVSEAACWVNEPFAIWTARELAREAVAPNSLRLVGLWAWFSQHPQTDGHRLMKAPWRFEMGHEAARAVARSWLDRLRLELSLGERKITDVWLRPGPFEGHDFVPLDSGDCIDREAAVMKNCIRSYGGDLVGGACRLWSIRRDGQSLANLEVGRRRARPLLHISQLKGPRNRPASIELWWLAARWLHQHDLISIRPQTREKQDTQPDSATWRRLWLPYWRAKRRIPDWLPLAPSWRVIAALW